LADPAKSRAAEKTGGAGLKGGSNLPWRRVRTHSWERRRKGGKLFNPDKKT